MSRHGLSETFVWASYKKGTGRILRALARDFHSLAGADSDLLRQMSVALGTVILENDAETAKLLLDLGAGKTPARENDRRENDPYCLNCLLMTAAEGNHLEVMKVLIEAGANVNARRGKSLYKATNALAAAVERGSLDAVHTLLASGATDSDGSAINAAARYHRLEILPILLSARDEGNGYHPEAVNFKLLDIRWKSNMLDLLIHHGFQHGIHHVLLRAASRNHVNMVRSLLKHKMKNECLFDQHDLDAALAEALRRKHIEAATPLLHAGATVNPVDKDIMAVYEKYAWLMGASGTTK